VGRIRDAKTNVVTVIGLIIVPVLGLLLMWRYTNWSVRTKQIWTLVAISLWVVGLALKLA
jgi:uncharacterized membrane protein